MILARSTSGLCLGLLFGASSLFGAGIAESPSSNASPVQPVTPNASAEAKALLQLLYSISGQRTLSGQHNFPNTKDTFTQRAIQAYAKVPAVFGQDFGFAAPGNQDARVPVLWRPYHEMNGDWFWWGGRRRGERGTAVLYRQMFDRSVSHHKLNNLIWVWSVDRPTTPARQFTDDFPGTKYFDVASLDVYRSDYKQSYYDDLLKLVAGRPIALAEVGPAPTIEILEQQPKWAWWMTWAGMGGGRRGSAQGTVIELEMGFEAISSITAATFPSGTCLSSNPPFGP